MGKPWPAEEKIVETLKTQSSEKNMNVDRRYRNSKSPTPTPYRSRSRSRSPYRASVNKRRRDDYPSSRPERDPRRLKSHYDDPPSHRNRVDHHQQSRYAPNNRHYQPYSRRRDSRSRSRSPYRNKQVDAKSSAITSTPSLASASKTFAKQKSHGINSVQPELAPDSRDDSKTLDAYELSPVDEAALIEERRKRREALKAKLKSTSQPSPLLAQALHTATTTSTPTTPMSSGVLTLRPGVDHDDASDTAVSAPSTPSADLPLPTPNILDEGDEPTAADYDPTEDMAEQQARHNHRFEASDSEPKQQTDPKEIDLPVVSQSTTETLVDIPELKKQDDDDDFDMFADDIEDKGPLPSSKPKIQAASKETETQVNLADNWDDADKYYKIKIGDSMDKRYRIEASLGKGVFSAVVQARDEQLNKVVAIKIIRSHESMKKAGYKEIGVLQKLAAADPGDKKHVIRLERHFEFKGHLCMVFEHLDMNLREVLKKHGRLSGINIRGVRTYAQQMFSALSLLRKCNIIHADIKPDNMLVGDGNRKLKVCDLGSAGDASENEITPILVSRFYRAPEIMLGIPHDYAIDMWSVGCTLYELYTAKHLFKGPDNNQMLKSIMECRGKIGSKMLKKGEYSGEHFDEAMQFRSFEKDRMTNKDVVRMITFSRPANGKDLKSRIMRASNCLEENEAKELPAFVDLLDRCLALNPEKRITPEEALTHPFIKRKAI